MNIFNTLLNIAVRKPKYVLSLTFLLCLLAIGSSLSIHLKTSNLDLISEDIPEVQNFLEFANRFGTPNVLVIVLNSSGSTKTKAAAVDKIATELRKLPGVRRVIDRSPNKLSMTNIFEKNYFHSRDKSRYFLFVQPRDIRTNVTEIAPLVSSIRQAVSKITLQYKDLEVGYTGIPQYALDDQEVIQKDISILSAVSLVLIILLFITAFSSIKAPIYAVATLIISVILTLGIIPWVPGHLTLLSAPFAMMIFGLGIDYGIHLVHHLEQKCRKYPNDYNANIVGVVSDLKQTLLAACATTVSVFLVLISSDFRGFRELGIIAAYGMVICLICMLFLLPALLSLFPIKIKDKVECSRVANLVNKLEKFRITPIFLVASVFALFLPDPIFDTDYLNLQPKESKAVELERYIISESEYSPYFAGFTVDSLNEAKELSAKLRESKLIANVSSASDIPDQFAMFLTKEQREFFTSKDGKFAVYAFPSKNIWDPDFEREFLAEMRSFNTDVTGMPFIGNVMMEKTKESLSVASELAIIVVLLILAIEFRSILLTLIVAFPPILAMFWMQACMSIFGIPYNPLDIMALPIVLGIGVDDSIHITHRFLKMRGNMDGVMNSAGRSIVLTSFTTLAAFGTLCFSSHIGLRSFSLMLSIGVFASLLFSLTVLPWLLALSKKWILPKDQTNQQY